MVATSGSRPCATKRAVLLVVVVICPDVSAMFRSPTLLLLVGAAGLTTTFAGAEEAPSTTLDSSGTTTPALLVVTADRQTSSIERTTATVDVVDQKYLTNLGHPANVWSALSTLPGTDVLGSSGGFDGGNTSVRIRGGNSADTKLLLDGIPLNDPTSPSGNPNFATLGSAGLERIEVVRGGQSGLYGSDAVTGVVNLLTIRPTATPEVSLLAEGGSFYTARATAAVSGPISNDVGYAVSLGGLTTRGFSTLTDGDADGDPGNNEKDGIAGLNGTARIETTIIPGATLYLAGRTDDVNQDYDGFDPATFAPDPGAKNVSHSRLWRGSTGGIGSWGKVDAAVDLARTATNKTFYEESATTADSSYQGLQDYVAGRLTFNALTPQRTRTTTLDHAAITVGADLQTQNAIVQTAAPETNESDRIGGLWGQALVGDKWAEVSATARGDEHSREGGNSTWRLGAAAFPAEPVKVHGAIGTTFRAPSLFELYAPFFGNEDVEAQEARDWETGLDLSLPAEVTLSSTYFHFDYEQTITYDPTTFVTTNGGPYSTEGVETAVHYNDRGTGPRLAVAWTWQQTDLTDEEVGSGIGFLLLPTNKAIFMPSWHEDRWLVGLTVSAVSSRQSFTGTDELHGYCLLGANAAYFPAPNWEIYVRGENLGNTAYTINPGFSTMPIAAFIGATATL